MAPERIAVPAPCLMTGPEPETTPPKVSVREGYDAWIAGGRRGVVERASEIAQNVMATHRPVPLPPEVDRELDRILKAAEDEKLGGAGR